MQTSAHFGQVLVVGAVLSAVVATDAGVGVMVVFIAVGGAVALPTVGACAATPNRSTNGQCCGFGRRRRPSRCLCAGLTVMVMLNQPPAQSSPGDIALIVAVVGLDALVDVVALAVLGVAAVIVVGAVLGKR